MLRLTQDTRGVAEVVAVAEHVASLTVAAAAFQLTPDVPAPRTAAADTAVMPLVDEASAGDGANTLAEIALWTRGALEIDHVPAIWRTFAHDPTLLAATWRKDQLVLAAGVVDAFVKGCVALAVAQSRRSPYWISYFTQYLRARGGADNTILLEIAGAVMHYEAFNTIAHGMRLEPPFSGMEPGDVASGGRFEQLVPGVRRRTAPST